jgi:hypothetical protein
MGQAQQGISLLLEGLAMYRATGANLVTPFFLMTLAEVYCMEGNRRKGSLGLLKPPHW